ncbi:hypothetical protein V491_06331 [Pseudogymnoascus sp. VKM F-3775]|nr:hypothetical protein V491_06331 [Pseudogymnoascus sp. VKM F-3775]
MNSSPPPTPPSRAPKDEELRFKSITSPCEWAESYHPGGYHPVHLGDVFNNGRYKVMRKLGEGAYSTVWLARDVKDNRYVALKILVSRLSKSTIELQILQHIAQAAPLEGDKYITKLLDGFEHQGPNGNHKCLVFDPMGPNVNVLKEELSRHSPSWRWMKVRYPPHIAKSILKQTLQALAFLHKNGIAHGDFQPGNMLFTLKDIESEGEDILRQQENMKSQSTSPPIERIDGKKDSWAPRYLCIAQPLTAYTYYTEGFVIKLSDMGGAYFLTDPPKNPVTPTGLRSPELVLTGAVHKSLDIWSFGCLLYELITGQPLFMVWSEEKLEKIDDLMLSFITILGPLPDELYSHWTSSALYFTPEHKLFNCAVGGAKEGEEPFMFEH